MIAPHILQLDREELQFLDSDMDLVSITALKDGKIKWEHTYPVEQARGIWARKVQQGWVNPVQVPKV